MVYVGVSKLGKTQLIFVDPAVKINGAFYRDVLLIQQLLPVVQEISGYFFILQQDSAPAHRARDTIKLLERETPTFIAPNLWPPNTIVQILTQWTSCKIWGEMQQRIYQTKVHDLDELKQRLIYVWHGSLKFANFSPIHCVSKTVPFCF